MNDKTANNLKIDVTVFGDHGPYEDGLEVTGVLPGVQFRLAGEIAIIINNPNDLLLAICSAIAVHEEIKQAEEAEQ